MTYLVPVQIRLPRSMAAQVKAHCAANDLRVGVFLRALVMDAFDKGLGDIQFERRLARIEQDQCFTAVALAALLAGHPEPDMRARAHSAFARKSERRRARDGVLVEAGL